MALGNHRLSVLLIEDTPDDERLALRALQKSGCQVDASIARDGEEAIRILESSDVRLPDLVLLDLKLPKISGIEVLRVLRTNDRTTHLPVIVLTSSDEESDLLACYRLHCNAYIRKAVDYTEYMETMRRTLDFWLMVNRLPHSASTS